MDLPGEMTWCAHNCLLVCRLKLIVAVVSMNSSWEPVQMMNTSRNLFHRRIFSPPFSKSLVSKLPMKMVACVGAIYKALLRALKYP